MSDEPEIRRPSDDEDADRASTQPEHDREARDGGDAAAAGTVEEREALARDEDITDA